jgi:hypothetical protein
MFRARRGQHDERPILIADSRRIGVKKQKIGTQSQTWRRRRHYFVWQSRRATRRDLKET